MGMKWTEVRLGLRRLRLPARRTKGKEPKAIPLDGDLLKLIQPQRKLHDKKFPSCEYVFPDNDGQKITYDRAIDQFPAACKRLASQKVSRHGTAYCANLDFTICAGPLRVRQTVAVSHTMRLCR
jgi:integrase